MNKFCTSCGNKLLKDDRYCWKCGNKIKKSKLIPIIIVLISGLFISILFFGNNTEKDVVKDDVYEPIMKLFREENKELGNGIESSVVNVLCPYLSEPMALNSDGIGGSGVVFDEEGLVVTNSHIIPQQGEELDVNEEGCIVVFPDNETGLPKEAYLAHPNVYIGYSDDYDIAWLEIYDVYTGTDGEKYGNLPKNFPTALQANCEDETINLGDKILVYGYPQATGGYSLTITEGIVSSFTGDGLITSAKIDSGNSGGLAADEKGCFIGIPSAVNLGEAESYGIIITSDTILDFFNEVVSSSE